jgi:DNA-binding transcriptional ArsR family regulator
MDVMLTTSNMSEVAALVGDPVRATMLLALMDGRALTAGELATVAGVSAQTTSSHLARLRDAGLLSVENQGRHRYHRLASPLVASMIESIMAVASAARPVPKIRTGPRDKAMRQARTCYDHLAGRIAVAINDRMVACGHLDLSADGGVLTGDGAAFLQSIGVDLERSRKRKTSRVFCRPCFDWSERRHHLAGTLGAAMLEAYIGQGWMRRAEGSRAVQVTPAGRLALDRAFALDHTVWEE